MAAVRVLLSVALLWATGVASSPAPQGTGSSAQTWTDSPSSEPRAPGPSEFFSPTRVHVAHLTLSSDQWAEMQPKGGGFGFGGFGNGFLGAEGSRNGVAARAGVVFDYTHAAIDVDGVRFHDVGVRYKGNGSYMQGRGAGKISIKVDLNKFVDAHQIDGATTLNFQNNMTDISWMNEVIAYRLYRDAGSLAPRSSYARVYVTVTGQFERRYFGLYSISENVDTHFLQERFGTKKGAIFKPSTRTPFTSLGADWRAYNQTYDPKTDLTELEKQRIIDFCTFVSTASDADFQARIGSYLDLDQFARYLAVLAWIGNSDSLLSIGQNYYVFLHPTSQKLVFIAWDQDFSFSSNRSNPNWAVHYPWSGVNLFLGRVYEVGAFRTAYLARLAEFNRTIFKPERVAQMMADIVPVIRPAIEEEGTQWLAPFDQIASGQSGILPFVRSRVAFVERELAK